MQLKANRAMRYGARLLKPGETFTARNAMDRKVLIAAGLASSVPALLSAPQAMPEDAQKPKRQYRKRQAQPEVSAVMTAEDEQAPALADDEAAGL